MPGQGNSDRPLDVRMRVDMHVLRKPMISTSFQNSQAVCLSTSTTHPYNMQPPHTIQPVDGQHNVVLSVYRLDNHTRLR